jgi:hypothetical protein
LLHEAQYLGPGRTAPALRDVAPAYDLAQFKHLLRTGRGVGDRDLGLMTEVSRTSFVYMADDEIAAVHTYLTAPPAVP